MLRKLMKHELLATGRIMLPMFALVMLAAVGGNISTYRLLETDNGFFNTVGVLLLTVFIVAIFAACLLAFALMVNRFYQNLLKDEGYLMMTLPVTVHEHIAAKLLVSMIWFALTALVIVLSVLVLVWQADPAMRFMLEIGELIRTIDLSGQLLHAIVVCIEMLLLVVLWGAGICLQFYAAMAVGHSFSSHKLALSFVAYFVLQFALQIISVAIANLLVYFDLDGVLARFIAGASDFTAIHVTLLLLMGVALVFGAVHYVITAYFMKKRLNLN